MQRSIKSEIYFDGKYYCARCLNIDVFTQGKTLDEVMKNLREAVSLHIEDIEEDKVEERVKSKAEKPSILAMMEIEP